MKIEKNGTEGRSAVRRSSVREDGVLLLKIYIEYPQAVCGKDAVNALYERFYANCEKWATERLAERIKAEYDASEDELKRFRFGSYEYSFSAKISAQTEEYLFTVLDTVLRKKGKKEPVRSARRSYVFRKRDGLLVPPRMLFAKGETARTGKLLCGRATGVCFRDGEYLAFRSDGGKYAETAVRMRF